MLISMVKKTLVDSMCFFSGSVGKGQAVIGRNRPTAMPCLRSSRMAVLAMRAVVP